MQWNFAIEASVWNGIFFKHSNGHMKLAMHWKSNGDFLTNFTASSEIMEEKNK